jgi:6-phosphogluconolactonase
MSMDATILAPGEALLVAARGAGAAAGLHRYMAAGGGLAGGLTGGLIAPAAGLAALALHPHLPVVYGVAGLEDGRLWAWSLSGAAALALGEGPSGGAEPCAIAVDPGGRALVVTNYMSGSLGLQRLREDGGLAGAPERIDLGGSGPDPERQEAAHPHHALFAHGGLHVTDLGADLLRHYAPDLGAGLVPRGETALPPGSGPRHAVALADGRLAITGELAGTLMLGRPGAGEWAAAAGSARPGPARSRSPRNYPGDLQPSASGRHVYFANRGHDTIATFDVAGRTPRLVAECDAGAAWPQHLLVHRGWLLVAGWDTDAVVALPLADEIPGPPQRILSCPGPGWLAALPAP